MNQPSFIDPPKSALRLFRWYCQPDRLEELEGDLWEMHEKRQQQQISKLSLQLRFWWDVIRCFKVYSVKKTPVIMNFSLLQSYITVALRNSRKNLGPVAINIIGMGLSLGFCITIYMLHAYNLEFDDFYDDVEDVYRVQTIRWVDDEQRRYELAPLPFVTKLESEVAAVSEVTYFETHKATVLKDNEYFDEILGSIRPNFFNTFDLPLLYGDYSAINDPKSLFLTRELAEKYFLDQMPVGQSLQVHIGNNKSVELLVAGVFDYIPLNSSFHFNMLINHQMVMTAIGASPSSWDHNHNVAIFIKTQSPESVTGIMRGFLAEQNQQQENWKAAAFDLMPFHSTDLTEDFISYSPTNSRVEQTVVIIFTVLAVLILLVACLNLANTAMAMMSKRVREIGVRKTLGTSNAQLFVQFLIEMLVISVLSFALAILLSNSIAEQVFGLFDVGFFLKDISIVRFVPFILVFLLICTLAAGILPALYAWRFSPVAILQGKQSLAGVGWFQRLLTAGQYALSICLLVCAWASAQNSEYFKSIDLGYNYDQVVMIPLNAPDDYRVLKNELDKLPATAKVIGTTDHHGIRYDRSYLKSDTAELEIALFRISPEYFSTMEIDLIQGRSFIEGSTSDLESSLIVNREFAKRYLETGAPIGQQVIIDNSKRRIIGVTDDIIHELYADYKPRATAYIPTTEADYQVIIAKTSNNSTSNYEDDIKEVWAGLFQTPYRGKGQQMVDSFYASRDARNLKFLFLSIAMLGSILSFMGIFSLAAMNVAKRTKEISIRRILGAGIGQVLLLVNKSFLIILLIAFGTGVFGGMFLSNVIMNMIYKFYAEAAILDSILIGMIVVLVALSFISMAVLKPVTGNPSQGLRTE